MVKYPSSRLKKGQDGDLWFYANISLKNSSWKFQILVADTEKFSIAIESL